jgi:hypothetical protein
MERHRPTARPLARLCAAGALAALALAGCGGGDYKNENRPPRPINVNAEVSNQRVSLSPGSIGAGPLVLVVTNQSDAAQEITLESDTLGGAAPGVQQTTGPINPNDTGQIQVDAKQGTYRLRVGDEAIAPAKLTVGAERDTSQNTILLP